MKKIVLLATRWLMTTISFLLAAGIFILSASFFASYYTDQWHWFQRSGALLVSIGAILSTRRLLRSGLDGLMHGRSASEVVATIEKIRGYTEDLETKRDLVSAYWGFAIVGLGTIVWAYGDLVECLIEFNVNCLSR